MKKSTNGNLNATFENDISFFINAKFLGRQSQKFQESADEKLRILSS